MDDFKKLLPKKEDQVARKITRNLLIYAAGAGIQFADREAVEKIVAKVKERSGAQEPCT